ncbi:MAG: hypothetical protein NWQ13_03755, partial [Glaciimonas sp.]|nr:hypothetical protein [Glaciimonas sp.]
RQAFASQFRGLWTNSGLIPQLTSVAEAFHNIDGWADGWHAIRQTLRYDKDSISAHSLSELQRLEGLLTPKNLAGRIRVEVLSQNSFFDDIDDEDTDPNIDKLSKYQLKLKQLGRLAGDDTQLITDFLPALLKTNSQNIHRFSCGVAQSFHNIQSLLTDAKSIIVEIERPVLNLAFIFGLIEEWNKIDADAASTFLNSAVKDSIWEQFFPQLQVAVPLNDAGYTRLMYALELGKAQIRQFNCLQFGGTTATLSANQVMTLILSIADKPDGIPVAIDILHMVIHGAKEKPAAYQCELANYCIDFCQKLNWQSIIDDSDESFNRHLNAILEFSLQSPIDDENIELILQRLIDFKRTSNRMYFFYPNVYLTPFLLHYTKKTLDFIYKPDDDGSYTFALRLLSDNFASWHEKPLFQAPEHLVLEWCQVSPNDRLKFIAQICSPFKLNQIEVDNGSENSLSEHAKNIFRLAENKKEILDIFIDKFPPSGGIGSLAAIIRSRISALDELNTENDITITHMIVAAKERLEEMAVSWATQEENRDRSRNESFE